MITDSEILSKLYGGKFGLKIKDAMTGEVQVISPYSTIFEASIMMIDHSIRRIPVVENKNLEGIITVTDIISRVCDIENKKIPKYIDVKKELKKEVKEIMTTDIISINQFDDIGIGIDKIINNDVSSLPIISKEHILKGIITRLDIIVALIKKKDISSIIPLMEGKY
jgi:predicted transcriptional regulator